MARYASPIGSGCARHRRFSAVLAAVLASAEAWADETPDAAAERSDFEESALPEIVVSADAEGADGTSPRLKSAQLSAARAADPTGAITTVERSPAANVDAPDAASMAARAPGLTVRDQGHNQPVTISLRGSSPDQVPVLVDGIRLNGLAGGGFDLSLFPAAFIRRLSVVRGANGATYGSGTLGGAVSLELLSPGPGEKRLFGEIGWGSFLSFDGSLGGAADLSGTRILAGIQAKTSRGDYPFDYDPTPLIPDDGTVRRRRENNEMQRYGALVRVQREGRADIDFFVEADGGRRGVPGAVQAPTRYAEQNDASIISSGRVRGALMPGLEAEGRLSGRLGFLQWSPDRRDRESWQNEHSVTASASLRKSFSMDTLEVGGQAGREGLSGPFHGNHGRTTGALFAANELEIGVFTLAAAARGEFTGSEFGFLPRLGIGVVPAEWLELSANVGRSFRVPSFGELYLEQGSISPNPDLTPETAIYGDASAAVTLAPIPGLPDASLHLAASGFVTRYGDVILYELYGPMRVKPFNLGAALAWGGEFEAELAAALPKGVDLRLAAAYTLQSSRNQSRDVRYRGKELPFRPRHRAAARLEISVWRLEAFAALDFQSRQFTNRSSTDALDGHLRSDAGLRCILHRKSGLSLGAVIKNIGGTQGQDLYGYPLTGRSFHVTLGFDTGSESASPRRR